MAGGLIAPFVSVRGFCWRAVAAGQEAHALDGTIRTGRYNRPGERTLYMSGSPDGVTAAMARYGDAARTLLRLRIEATSLVDLRNAAACAALRVDPSRAKEDWLAAIERGEEPASWPASDRARAIGAAGLIDASRRAPGAWHLVLFRWNVSSAPHVEVA